MLQILHKGNQISLDVDTSGFNGDTAHDALALAAFVGGKVVAASPTGCKLADGDETGGAVPVGFLINDASGSYFENVPAVASGKMAVTFGNCVVVTDQVVGTLTFAKGDKLYVGTGANKGLITNVAPANAREFGIALSSATPAAPNLTIAVLG